VDAFLTKRGGASEHEATLSAKTEFMQLWDGIEGARGMRVLVMGATNRWGAQGCGRAIRRAVRGAARRRPRLRSRRRLVFSPGRLPSGTRQTPALALTSTPSPPRPWCIDDAVLRRFGLQYEVGLPGAGQRRAILEKYLARHEAESRALRRAGLLAPGEGGVDPALLEDRCGCGGRRGMGQLLLCSSAPGGARRRAARCRRPGPHRARPPSRARRRPLTMLGAQPGEGCLSAVVRATEGYSGSDLTEVCAQAAQDVLAEKWAQEEAAAAHAHAMAASGARGGGGGPPAVRMRQLRGGDLLAALELVKPSTSRAGEYAAGQYARGGSLGAGASGDGLGLGPEPSGLMLALMSALAAGAAGAGGSGSSSGVASPGGARGGGGGGAGGSGAAAAGGPSDEQLKALGLMVFNSLRGSAMMGGAPGAA
jgi:hypothetical protein